MSNGRFGIFEAAKKACRFAAEHRGYLLRTGVFPLCAQAATTLLIQQFAPRAAVVETYVWSFPANLVFAWFLFVEARLLLLGERLDRLPQDPAYLAARRHAMNLAVIVYLLVDLCGTAAGAWIDWVSRSGHAGSAPATVLVLLVAALLMWGLRFSVIHILAAVGYPVRRFLGRVRGMEFSARLLALGFLFALPALLALEIVLGVLLPGGGESALTPAQAFVTVLFSVPVMLLVPVLLNAAAAFALKEVLGGREAAT